MTDPEGMLKVLETHTIKCALGMDRDGIRGGLMVGGEYAWFTNGADIVLYSKATGSVESSRSFGQTDNSMEITFVQELHKSDKTMNMLLVGCSCKSFGILFVCQLPSLSIIRCIHTPSPISYISTINNESLVQDQLCDEFKIMSTILLIGLATGSVFAVDLRKRHIENQLRSNEIVVNESSPSKLFIVKKNEDSQEAKKISDESDSHLAMFINENFYNFYNKQCSGELNFGISCLLYTEEINAVAIGYITGHFQLWDCKIMQTLYVLKKPECFMPISHITFLEQADDPHKLCYLWIIQSDNSKLPNAMMIALSYEHRTLMSNGRFSYRAYKEYNIKLKMSLQKDSGIGRCISALTLCNDTLVRKSTDMSENCGITLFTMLMEIRQNVDVSPKSYVFLFDINQWYKAKMPSVINHLKVSKPYASFVKLPDYASYLDFNISDKTLRPFGSNFRNNVESLYYPSSIYFECDCLSDTKIIRFKHVGIQQDVLDKLILKNWSLFLNPSLIFHQCLQKNLKPFFWDKTYDYDNYSLLDKFNFMISIIVENNMMSVIDECAEKWKNGTHSEVIILHLVQCLWNHVMLVKQYADQLCVPLFDCSGMLDGKKNVRMLNDCLSQILRVENFFKRMQLTDCVQITNVDLVDRVKILNLVTQYFNAILYFVNIQLLPKQIEEDPAHRIMQCDFTSLIQYACKRRMEFGDLPLYLIDAIVTNEPIGNKLIEQWKHECIEETKGLYPPSDIQCLLRIYLNAELSNQIKDFITIYFLIDVCSVQKMDEITANIFNDTFVKNEELYKLCCASWLFDHDMFEDAMLILASNNEWMVNDKSWNWYHWTVLKLFVFKKQYYWAQIYLELFNIKLINLDDHKFYVNLQIMNNHCFDALCHLHLSKIEDKKILFEYIFDRFRHTNQLKAFLSYPMDSDEKKLFFSCLKKFEDTELIQFMFLVQEKRYSEALEVYKLLKIKTNSKNENIFTIASVLVDKIKDNISPNNKSDINKRVFSNEEIKMTFANCFMDNHINLNKSNIFRSYGKLCLNNLIVPDDDIVGTTQGLDEQVSAINGVLSPLKIETVKQIEKKLLELLDTPFIQNVSYIPSATNCLVVSKKKSVTDNNQSSTIKLDKMPETLTFGLPDNNVLKVEKFNHKKVMSMIKVDSENKFVGNSDTNNLPINMIMEQTLITSHKLLKDNSKIELLETVPISYTVDIEEYEKMDISDSDQSGSIPDGENEEKFEEPDIILGDLNDTNNSEQPDDLLDDNLSTENPFNDTSTMSHDENEDILKELDIILEDLNGSNNSKELDIKLKGEIDQNFEETEDLFDHGIGIEHHSNQSIVIPDSEDEDNLEEPYVILKGEQSEYVEEPDIILYDSNGTNNSGKSDDLPDDDVNVENNSDQLNVIPDDGNEDNVEVTEMILDNANGTINLEQSDIILEGEIDGHFEESEDLLDGENEENVEESDFILEGENYENVNNTDFILDDDVNEKIRLDQPSVLLEGGNKENLEKPYIIPEDNLLESDDNEDCVEVSEMHDTNPEQPDVILENYIDENFEELDDFLDDDQSVVGNRLDQPSVLLEGGNKENLEKPYIIPEDNLLESDDNEDYVEVSEMILDDANCTISLEQPDIILECEIDGHFEESEDLLNGENEENLVESNFIDDDVNVENRLDQPSVLPDGEEKDNLEKPYIIPEDKNEDNLLKSDDLLDAVSVEHNSDEPIVLPDDKNVEVPEMILDNTNDTNNYSKQSDVIFENFEELDDFLDDDQSVGNRSDQPSVPDGGNKDNLEKPYIIPKGKNEDNLLESDDSLDAAIVEHDSDQAMALHDDENEENLEVPEMTLDDAYDTNNSEQPDIILENFEDSDDFRDYDQSVENRSDQPSVLPDGGNKNNLEKPDIILRGKNYENIDETEITLDDSNNTNSLEELSVILNNDTNVQIHSDQLSVKPDSENKDSLEEPIVLESEYKENSEETYASKQNLSKLFEPLKNEKTPNNNDMVDRDNVIYPTDSQSNVLKNLSPSNYCLTEENRLNCENQITAEDNKNYICNIVDGDKISFVIEKDDIAEIVENTNKDIKSSEPISFQIVENPKDLCSDQNEDYLYDEYQYSNNDIFSELSTIENPIPEYGFNHLTMTENESNQLEVYDTLNQPTSVLLNESFLNNISLSSAAEVNETGDLVANNNVEMVTDKISVDLKPSSSNINLYNQEIKSFQLVGSKDIASHQVNINILNSATKEYAVEIQSGCPPAISEPSETLIIEEFPSDSMPYKDILCQEETSKLVHFVKSSSDTEFDNNLAENVSNLRTDEKNKQPLIEQVINIPNLRKRKSRAKCIPLTDTKLTTKSKSDSKTKQVDLKIISSNISFPTSDIFEDSLVSVAKKRSKCQKKISLVKRRRVCPKYVASIDGASNSKIDLKQSGENTKNKKIKELPPNNLPVKNKVTISQRKLKKLAMPVVIKQDSEINNKILSRNTISSTNNFEQLFFLEPKIVLERFDVSSYKNCFKQLAVPNDSQVTLSANKPNSQKSVALKRLRNGCLKSVKKPTAINTVFDLDEELKEDSINNDKKKAVTRKSKLNTSYKKVKVELDKNLKSNSNGIVLTLSKSDPINCVNKIHNNLINETIDLISDYKFVSDEVQEEMGQTKSDKEKLDWRIISHEVKTNMDAIPKIRIGRNKSELNTKYVGSLLDLESMKRGTKIVQEQELDLIKKSSETKILELNQQGRRMSSRKILKKLTCSCCTSKSMDVACRSNVLG